MNGAESLVRTLVGGGVNVCFANPGTSEMHFVAADQGAYQAFRAVHDRLSVCLVCDPPARLTR